MSDDYCYGGGSEMLMRYDVLKEYYLKNSVKIDNSKTIFVSPRGKKLDTDLVQDLVKLDCLHLISANYEGLDQRFIDEYVDLEVSIGDYVLTGGELPIMVLINCVCRHLESFLQSESLTEESFNHHLLEYDQYTKSNLFEKKVPLVLREGNHRAIKQWQHQNSILKTFLSRIDLWKKNSHQRAEIEKIKDYLFREYGEG